MRALVRDEEFIIGHAVVVLALHAEYFVGKLVHNIRSWNVLEHDSVPDFVIVYQAKTLRRDAACDYRFSKSLGQDVARADVHHFSIIKLAVAGISGRLSDCEKSDLSPG